MTPTAATSMALSIGRATGNNGRGRKRMIRLRNAMTWRAWAAIAALVLTQAYVWLR